MTSRTLTLVAALGRNGALGRDGHLLWQLPGDLPRFKALTQGRPLVMGRKTYESIGRALPGRRTIVVTRDARWVVPDAETASSLEEALALAGDDEVCCGGGGEIYALALPQKLDGDAGALLDGDHLVEQAVPLVDKVVAQQHREGLVAHVVAGT